jgi:hypothetical protein
LQHEDGIEIGRVGLGSIELPHTDVMVCLQALATVVTNCLEADPADGLVSRIVSVLGAFTFFLDPVPVLLDQIREDALTLSDSGIP